MGNLVRHSLIIHVTILFKSTNTPLKPSSLSKANTPNKPAPNLSTTSEPPAPPPSPPKRLVAPPAPPSPVEPAPPPSPHRPSPADLDYDGYTTSDSFSHDIVTPSDWRISRIKHRTLCTSRMVTQYWHFIEGDEDEDGVDLLEYSVLRDVLPACERRGGGA
jgi:hypothetical protein